MKEITSLEQLGKYVRAARTKAGISQRKFAKKLDMSASLIVALELGNAPKIRFDKVMQILSALGLGLAITNEDSAGESNAETVEQETVEHTHTDSAV